MNEDETQEWLQAVLAHPETIEADVRVAVAVAVSGAANGIAGIDQEDVDDAICALESYGFLESVVSFTDEEGNEDHLLKLRMPTAV